MHCASKPCNIDVIGHREKIQAREFEVASLQTAPGVFFQAISNSYDEGLNQETNSTLSSNSKESRTLRSTRNSNVEISKRKVALEIGDADKCLPSPKRFTHPPQNPLTSLLTPLGHNLLYQRKRSTYRM